MNLEILWSGGHETLEVSSETAVLEAVRGWGKQNIEAPCGGNGTCGKCKAYLVEPGGEISVLMCRTKVQEHMVLRLPDAEKLCVLLGEKQGKITPDPAREDYGLACDIGTTTLAMELVNRKTGECVASVGCENPQRAYGADVMSRIRASMQGRAPAMTEAIRGKLREMIQTLAREAEVPLENLGDMALAANTTMSCLVSGLRPDALGTAPYIPEHTFGDFWDGADLGLPIRGKVYIAPAVSGFVGGDITADILAANLDQREDSTLLVDVGTNGEMVLGHGDVFVACAAAAGPAFEGAGIRYGMTAAPGAISRVDWTWAGVRCQVIGEQPPRGICGSGLIDAAAMMLQSGAMDETGRMLNPDEDEIPEELEPYLYLVDGEPAFCLMGDVTVTQSDIRKLQLCKGAIRAGIQLLMEKNGAPVRRLLLAGGFGSVIRPECAAKIGLIPQELLPVTEAVGNIAVQGARMALCSQEARQRLEKIRCGTEYLELSGEQAFQEAYIAHMSFV